MCSRLQGLRVAPKAGPSVNGHWPISGVLVLPTITAPAARSRRTELAVGRLGAGTRPAAERGRLAGHVDVVLDRDRHPEQRQPLAGGEAPVRGVGLGERGLRAQAAEGVERGLGRLDPRQRRLDQLDRAHLAGGQQLRLAAEPGEGDVVADRSSALHANQDRRGRHRQPATQCVLQCPS